VLKAIPPDEGVATMYPPVGGEFTSRLMTEYVGNEYPPSVETAILNIR
jgi:hypothetical protein